MSKEEIEIESINEGMIPEVLSLLDEVFGPGHDEDWFDWKHRSNPAGRSPGWVALDEEGIVGVRLFMRWNLSAGEKLIRAVRPVDTATAPRARRQGIFSRLTRASLAHLGQSATTEVVFNTPNRNSREGYRRLGWTLLDPIRHKISFVRPSIRVPGLLNGEETSSAFDLARTQPNIHTLLTSDFVRWRYDRRSGHDYRMISLRESDGPNGIIYRISKRRLGRLIVVCEVVGSEPERRMLLSAVARSEGALAWIAAHGQGSDPVLGGIGVERGSSVVAVRALRRVDPDPTQRRSWTLSLGDLEDVI